MTYLDVNIAPALIAVSILLSMALGLKLLEKAAVRRIRERTRRLLSGQPEHNTSPPRTPPPG